jgi:hypothetical protein
MDSGMENRENVIMMNEFTSTDCSEQSIPNRGVGRCGVRVVTPGTIIIPPIKIPDGKWRVTLLSHPWFFIAFGRRVKPNQKQVDP